MSFDLNKKVAIVTGGAQGIGLAIVKELLRNGLKGVAVLDVNEIAGQKAVDEIQKEFGPEKVLFQKTDVAIRKEFEDAFEKTISAFNHLDIVINNAGVACERNWEKEISINLTGTINGTMLGLECYLHQSKSGKEGVILNISSIAAFGSFFPSPVYAATKSGVVALTRAMGHALHYDRKNVKVMAICPGFTDTGFVKVKKEDLITEEYQHILKYFLKYNRIIFQTPEEVAKIVVDIIKEGQNGSVWVAENKEPPYEIECLSQLQQKKK
ncbi:hypothetical protein RI129_011520 [Pyrocoelia pectoralis]|uniref:Alcohol dehydrogenase n=1 Tax=Pyrocoelia pectoralis TaxID=417401 RepID=A0AAN7V1Q0_9COLE